MTKQAEVINAAYRLTFDPSLDNLKALGALSVQASKRIENRDDKRQLVRFANFLQSTAEELEYDEKEPTKGTLQSAFQKFQQLYEGAVQRQHENAARKRGQNVTLDVDQVNELIVKYHRDPLGSEEVDETPQVDKDPVTKHFNVALPPAMTRDQHRKLEQMLMQNKWAWGRAPVILQSSTSFRIEEIKRYFNAEQLGSFLILHDQMLVGVASTQIVQQRTVPEVIKKLVVFMRNDARITMKGKLSVEKLLKLAKAPKTREAIAEFCAEHSVELEPLAEMIRDTVSVGKMSNDQMVDQYADLVIGQHRSKRLVAMPGVKAHSRALWKWLIVSADHDLLVRLNVHFKDWGPGFPMSGGR